jgi:hypothetical protein
MPSVSFMLGFALLSPTYVFVAATSLSHFRFFSPLPREAGERVRERG